MLAKREEEKRVNRSFSQRVSAGVTRAAGQPWFAIVHTLFFALWILLNSGWVRRVPPFDPFPFSFLNFMVSIEAIFLSLTILRSQNLESRQADDHAKLDLQINLLAERESTKALELLRAICQKHELPEANDPDLLDLLRPTRPTRVLDDVEKQRPDEA